MTSTRVSLAALVVGALVLGVSAAFALPNFAHSINGPRLHPPGTTSLTLGKGPWTLYEQTGSRSGLGVTLGPTQVIVSGPGKVRIRSDRLHGRERMTRFGRSYTGAVRMEVSRRGRYTIDIRQTSHEVLVARPMSYGLTQWRPLVTGLLGALLAGAGAVLLLRARRGRQG